jgi:CHAT domain-containing protein/tetratricopeptide (TPR) repeat protein
VLEPGEGHLTEGDLDRLADESLLSFDSTSESFPANTPVAEHLAACQSCRDRLDLKVKSAQRLTLLRATSPGTRSGACLSDEELMNLAAGITETSAAHPALDHAASCDHCGPLLRQFVHQFSDDLSPAEKQLVPGLDETRDSRTELARRLAAASTPQDSRRSWFPSWKTLSLGFASAVAIGLVVVASFPRPEHRAEKLVAQAYSERRTLELRLQGSPHAPLQVNRGTARSGSEPSQSLLDLKALVSKNLHKDPSDSFWLQTKARTDLLDWDYATAMLELTQALRSQPESPSLKIDLASAYFEQARSLDRPVDYGSAIELLSQALAKEPNNPLIFFNRALVFEQASMFHEALHDWEEYLKLDPVGPWSDEGRKHAEDIRHHLAQDQNRTAPLLDIPAFVAAINRSDPSALQSVDVRVEDYLDLSIRDWIPKAFPPRGHETNSAEVARSAVSGLGVILLREHQDKWLNDLLLGRPDDSFRLAVMNLGQALSENRAGNASSAKTHALRAEMLFAKADSKPGLMRAQLEEVYALHRLFRGPECLTAALRLEGLASGTHYSWIKAQLGLEQFACFSSQTKMTGGLELISASRQLAESSRYQALCLRAIGFQAALETDKNNLVAAGYLDQAGLKEYWLGPYPFLRAYQFYDDLTDLAQDSKQWNLAAAYGREATYAVTSSENRSGEAMSRFRLSISEEMAGHPEEAAKEYAKAQSIFASLPNNSENAGFQADSELQVAAIEATYGHAAEARAHFLVAKGHLSDDFSSYDTWLSYFRTKAELALLDQNYDEMQSSCAAVVTIGEWTLSTLATEHDRVSWNRTTAPCYKTLVELELRRQNYVSALELWEWYQGAAVRKGDSPRGLIHFGELDRLTPRIPAPRQVQTHLHKFKNQTLLAFAELRTEVVAWAYDDRGIRLARIQVTPQELHRAVGEFANACANPNSDIPHLRDQGRTLYNLLLGPFSDYLEPDRVLIIEADGQLAKLPFQALVLPEGSYLGLQRALAFSPGLFYMLRLRPDATIRSDEHVLIVGEPALARSDADFIPLPDANREAREVASLFRNSTLISGKAATGPNIIEHLSSASVFHFAGHAISGPEGTGLKVAPANELEPASTLLTPDQIEAHRLSRTRLVVLSACSTAQPGDDGLADAGNISLAFLRGGVPHVVATRWAVDSSTVSELTRSFYSELLRGQSPGSALLRAATELNHQANRVHPYFWASFSVFGRA